MYGYYIAIQNQLSSIKFPKFNYIIIYLSISFLLTCFMPHHHSEITVPIISNAENGDAKENTFN